MLRTPLSSSKGTRLEKCLLWVVFTALFNPHANVTRAGRLAKRSTTDAVCTTVDGVTVMFPPPSRVTLSRPNTFSHQHASAMHWATWGGHTEIVKLLLEHKVRVPLLPMRA